MFFNSPGAEKAFPIKMILDELFSPTDQDNKDTTLILEDLAVIAATRWVKEMMDTTKVTYHLMSASGSDMSWKGSTQEKGVFVWTDGNG